MKEKKKKNHLSKRELYVVRLNLINHLVGFIQQLVTLYLGGFVVRVVSEIECLNAQECARKQSLAA